MQKHVWKVKAQKAKGKSEDISQILLKNRGLVTKKQQEAFLNPSLDLLDEIKFPQIGKAVDRIKQAIKKKEKIAVFSDYDADGICATAILWETIHDLGGDVVPYVPDRMIEGYGLNSEAVKKLAEKGVTLIVTVDNGITAVEQVEVAKKLGIDVIITDHHQKPDVLPKPYAFVWSDKICGAAVAWLLARALVSSWQSLSSTDEGESPGSVLTQSQILASSSVLPRMTNMDNIRKVEERIELAALATVADVMPLTGYNRVIVKEGLKQLQRTNRPGVLAICDEAGIKMEAIGTYEISHVIAPRINAMGRLENALESLRLLVTKNPLKARAMALTLATTNSQRQKLTEKMVEDAKLMFEDGILVGVLSHESWHEGVVGLVAGKMTEMFYRPMIAIAKGEEFSKGSARSIPGFNIVEALRALNGVFENVGGHPMAAGFTIRTEKIVELQEKITKIAKKQMSKDMLERILHVDMEIALHDISHDLYRAILQLEPFGFGNTEPIFVTKRVCIDEIKKVGSNGKHMKLCVEETDDDQKEMEAEYIGPTTMDLPKRKPFFDAIGFGMGELLSKLRPGDLIDIAYTISLNNWNNLARLELKIKDLRISQS